MADSEATDGAPAVVTLLRALAVVVLVVEIVLGLAVRGEGVAVAAGILQGLLGFAVLMALAFMCDMLDQIRENTAPRA